MTQTQAGRRSDCPQWCTRLHTADDEAAAHVHVSGALQVRRTMLRLVMTGESESGVKDGPFVLVGDQEYTLHEAEVLIGSLIQLVDQGRAATAPAVPRMRPAGP